MNTTEKEKAESVVSRSSKKKKNRKKRARQWTGYVDNLKTTIDCLYEMCRSEQSVAGCREAMLYLQSASNDFKSLIETINVEKEWSENQESQKRPSVAWEIRKSMSSPNPTSIKDKPLHPISSIIAEAVKNVSPTQESSETTAPAALTYARITAAAAVAAVAVSHPGDASGPADGWKVVSNRRRKSTSSTTVSEFDREMSVEKEKETSEEIPLNVYERLSSTSYKRGPQASNRTLTCPRSAMDLPQTRASMAKMAYSRQLLWEKNQQVLVEKLRAKQKKEKSTRQCGFTFADPQAVRKSVEAFNQQKSCRRGGKETTGSQSSTAELQSINEETAHPSSEHSEDLVPADPTPSSSISQPPKSTGSLFGYVEVPEELEKDEEWREMTEEEESLALEENSLNLEIKQAESMSIDAELERQVEAEADDLEKEEKKRQKKQEKQKKEEEMENFYKVFEEIRSLAWSELMEQEAIAQYSKNVHEPGTPVEKHEKMSSPSRRNRQKDDDDFGKRHEAKQKNAENLRQQLQEAKAVKLKELAKRVEEVREKQEALKERKRRMLEERMQRAADNRDKNIMEVIRKAKDDDQRVMEVKFIATLQEDNKRHDLLAKDACTEEKQKQLADERARKHEEKAAKKREQEAAATARRAQIRQLSEQKEQKEQKERLQKSSPRDSGAHPEDMLQYLHSLCDSPEVPASATWQWPSADPRGPRECTLCSVRVCSDLEAAVHLVCSKEHQDQTKTLTSGSVLEEIKRHFYGIFQDVASVDSEGVELQNSRNLREEALLKSREALRSVQLTDIPGPVTSPRNRTKSIRDFNLSIEKMTSKGQIDDKTQESVEKSLSELLSAVESDFKAESSSLVNLEQFCAISGPQKMCDVLLDWTTRGASLRLCIRMCHAFCTFLRDPRVAYSVVFKSELIRILDRIVALISTSSGDSPQLSALLDVLTATLKSVNSRIQMVKTPQKHLKHRELQKLDSEAPTVIENICGFLKTSLRREEILEALVASKGSALCSRIITLADQFEDSELLTDYVDVILKFTYSTRKSASEDSEASERIQKASKDLTSSIVSSFCQQTRILKTLNPERLLILTILLEDCLCRSGETLRKAPELVKERCWAALEKEEEAVLKWAELMDNVVERMETWQKRSVLLSWTGHFSCLQILEDVPIRLLVIGKHATRIIPTVGRVLEKFTNSEKAEMLGDCSGDLFFEHCIFPNRRF